MRSHTVPRKLLEQFAFDDPLTNSKRLWCYEKSRPIYKVSPKSATRWDGYFADPEEAAKEAALELRLKQEFEDPVNHFIKSLTDKTFILDSFHVRALTDYITILFHRSRARRSATNVQQGDLISALRALLSDDEKMAQIAATIEVTLDGKRCEVARETVVEVIEMQIEELQKESSIQSRYIQTMSTMMAYKDMNMLNGEWRIISTDPNAPFVVGDAPVVTWERLPHGQLILGQGFRRPNVEVLLPVAPTTCLHVLPAVDRDRPIQSPRTEEVNMAQAAFADTRCFSNLNSEDLRASLQPHFGTCRLAIDGFRLIGFDLKEKFVEILLTKK